MRRFILTGVLFFVLGAIATVLVFFAVNSYMSPLGDGSITDDIGVKIQESIDSVWGKVDTAVSTSTLKIPDEGLPLSNFSIEGAQKKALETAGIDTETFVITKDMLACAEKAVGADRVAAFVAGETPTVLEMGKMSPCLKTQ
jgi:hypothetical protein